MFYYLNGKSDSISLISLRKVIGSLHLNIYELEKYVVKLKASRRSKFIKINKMPIDMLNKNGAIILGSFPDVGVHRYVFSCKDEELVSEFREASQKLLGEYNDIDPKINNGMNRYYATNFLRDICHIAGYETKIKQVVANNSIPMWIFSTPTHFLRIYLRKMWDADGTVGTCSRKLKFSQTIAIKINPSINRLKLDRNGICFDDLPKPIKKIIVENPPRLITSMMLTLKMIEIQSKIYPERVYLRKNDYYCCEWSLRVTSYKNIKSFAEKINFSLSRKRRDLQTLLKSYIKVHVKRKSYLTILKSIKNNEIITTKEMEKLFTTSRSNLYLYLLKLKKKGFISFKTTKLKRGKYRPSVYVYKITERGEKFLEVLKNEYSNLDRSL